MTSNEGSMNSSTSEGLLDERSVVPYLVGRGLLEAADANGATATALGGGVSNVVLAVHHREQRLIVKQSLGRLRVKDEWLAPRRRILAEAAALDTARGLTPTNVPALVDRDDHRHVIVLEQAPAGWRDWKSLLLEGDTRDAVGGWLGQVLGRWHRQSMDGPALAPELLDGSSFEPLRVDPYYRTVARRVPETSRPLLALIEQMAHRRLCLVHGDFSPKNILVGPLDQGSRRVWVIDFEVAHLGDPTFDLAFLLSHLTMKALHRPEWSGWYDECLRAFADAYSAEVQRDGHDQSGTVLTPDWSYVLRHVGALLLARVKGKSPAEYLTAQQQAQAWRLGVELLHHTPDDLDALTVRRERIRR